MPFSDILAKLLGGCTKGANGKLKNLTRADQARLNAVLSRPLGDNTSKTIVKLVATLVNGLLGPLPLYDILHPVTGLVENLLGPKGVLGGLLGPKGVIGGLLNGLLGGNHPKHPE